jgi:hypothetical protein
MCLIYCRDHCCSHHIESKARDNTTTIYDAGGRTVGRYNLKR